MEIYLEEAISLAEMRRGGGLLPLRFGSKHGGAAALHAPANLARVEHLHRMQMQCALLSQPPLVQLARGLLCLVLCSISYAITF